jgi:hypothetical protein
VEILAPNAAPTSPPSNAPTPHMETVAPAPAPSTPDNDVPDPSFGVPSSSTSPTLAPSTTYIIQGGPVPTVVIITSPVPSTPDEDTPEEETERVQIVKNDGRFVVRKRIKDSSS